MTKQKEQPYRCWVPKCEFRCNTEKQLLKHYKKEHPDAKITMKENGSFEVDINGVKCAQHAKKADKPKKAAAPKAEKSKTQKDSEPKAEKPKKESKPKPDYSKLPKWQTLDEKAQAKIQKDVEKQVNAGKLTWSQSRRYVAETHSVSVWPYTLQMKADSAFRDKRLSRSKELRAVKKPENSEEKPVEATA